MSVINFNTFLYTIVLIITIFMVTDISIRHLKKKIKEDKNNIVYFCSLLCIPFIILIYQLKEGIINNTLNLFDRISMYLYFIEVISLFIIILLTRYKEPKVTLAYSYSKVEVKEQFSEIKDTKIEQQPQELFEERISINNTLSQEDVNKIFDNYKKYIDESSWNDFKLFLKGKKHSKTIVWNYHNNKNILQFKPHIFNLLNEIITDRIGLKRGYSYRELGIFIFKHFLLRNKKDTIINDNIEKKISNIGKRYKKWLSSN